MLFLEKVVDNEKLMECINGDRVFYIRSSKDFKVGQKKKMNLKKISPLGIDVVNYMLNVEIISVLNTPIYGLHTKIYTDVF